MPAPASPINNPATHGKEGIVALKLTSGASYVAIGGVTDWSLDMTTDKVETTAMGDQNKRYVIGLKDVNGSFTANFDKLSDVIFDAAESPSGCYLQIYPSSLAAQCWEGPAWLDASIKGGATAHVTIDATFVANGNWSRTQPVTATGATAGTPGTFTPAGASAPANFAGMTGITASPATAWTTGQHVILGDYTKAYWNGTAWTVGQPALMGGEQAAA